MEGGEILEEKKISGDEHNWGEKYREALRDYSIKLMNDDKLEIRINSYE